MSSSNFVLFDYCFQYLILTRLGPIFSKGLFGVLEFSQKTNQQIRRSSRSEFVRFFLGEFEDTKSPYEIIWPLHKSKVDNMCVDIKDCHNYMGTSQIRLMSYLRQVFQAILIDGKWQQRHRIDLATKSQNLILGFGCQHGYFPFMEKTQPTNLGENVHLGSKCNILLRCLWLTPT